MKSKRIYFFFSFIILGLAGVFIFQNCAPNKLSSANFSRNISSSLGVANVASRTPINTNNTAAVQQQQNAQTNTPAPAAAVTATPTSAPVVATPAPVVTSAPPAASFGGGSASSTASGPTNPIYSIQFTPSDAQASAGTPWWVAGNNKGLSYNDAVKLRQIILDKGGLPYVYNDLSEGFTVFAINETDGSYWQPIQAIKAIPQNTGDWSKIVGYRINDIAAALGYMPNDTYRACVNSGLIVTTVQNGTVDGTSPSMGCKSGTFIDHGSTIKWSCNCAGDFSGWYEVGGAANNCYRKKVQ